MTSVSVPAAVLARARETARELTPLVGSTVDADELLGGRAVLLGLTVGGRVSAGRATRMLAGADGWCALTLSRPDDVDAVPALVESDRPFADPWPVLEYRVRELGVRAFAERARLLGLPVGVLAETGPAAPVIRAVGRRAAPAGLDDLLVVDLSSMWAGPLCGRLLARAGATVVKVESPQRPDGTRAGPKAFFDWVNGGKLCYETDFTDTAALGRLLAAADLVIESSRPAALERRGLGPAAGQGRDGRIWLRITGHGSDDEHAHWVAFGDDAAVSGGLVSGTPDAPRFCADAIADPLTGLHAARAVLESHARGGAELIEVSMAAVAACYADLPRGDETPCRTAPSASPPASPPGADNERVDRLVAQRLAGMC